MLVYSTCSSIICSECGGELRYNTKGCTVSMVHLVSENKRRPPIGMASRFSSFCLCRGYRALQHSTLVHPHPPVGFSPAQDVCVCVCMCFPPTHGMFCPKLSSPLLSYVVLIRFSSNINSFEKSVRATPGDRHVQALQRSKEPSHVQQHPRVSVSVKISISVGVSIALN